MTRSWVSRTIPESISHWVLHSDDHSSLVVHCFEHTTEWAWVWAVWAHRFLRQNMSPLHSLPTVKHTKHTHHSHTRESDDSMDSMTVWVQYETVNLDISRSMLPTMANAVSTLKRRGIKLHFQSLGSASSSWSQKTVNHREKMGEVQPSDAVLACSHRLSSHISPMCDFCLIAHLLVSGRFLLHWSLHLRWSH